MHMVSFVLFLLLALNGAACATADSSGTPPDAAAAGKTPAADPNAAAPAPPASTDNKPAAVQQGAPSTPGTAPGERAVVARVNGAPIYKADFDSALASFMQNNRMGAEATEDQKTEAKKTVMDGLIGSELLF